MSYKLCFKFIQRLRCKLEVKFCVTSLLKNCAMFLGCEKLFRFEVFLMLDMCLKFLFEVLNNPPLFFPHHNPKHVYIDLTSKFEFF